LSSNIKSEKYRDRTPCRAGLVTASLLASIIVTTLFLNSTAYAQTLSHPNEAEARKLDETSCTDGFSFVVMADSHISPVFGVLKDIAAAIKPDFAILVGDSTQNGTEEDYGIYLNEISQLKFPWFTVPGNHEYRNPEGHTSMEGQLRFKKIFGKPDFSFTHCGWKFVAVNITAYDALMPGQLTWIKKQLEGFDGKAVVFMHYPPAIIKNWEEGYWTANAKEFMRLLEDRRVPYFFSGHIHIYDRMQVGPTTYIVTGGASGGVDSEQPREQFNSPDGGGFSHFIFVSVKDDKAVDSVVRPNLTSRN